MGRGWGTVRAPSQPQPMELGASWATVLSPGPASPPTSPASLGRGPEKEEKNIHFLSMHGDGEDSRQRPRGSSETPHHQWLRPQQAHGGRGALPLGLAAPPLQSQALCSFLSCPSQCLHPFAPWDPCLLLLAPRTAGKGGLCHGGLWTSRLVMGDARVPPTSRSSPRSPRPRPDPCLRVLGQPQAAGTQLGTKHTSLLWGQWRQHEVQTSCRPA